MARQVELEILVDRLEKTLDQAKEMELEHLHFLLSMAFKETQRQLSVVPAPLRLVVCTGTQR
jgi:hypothetical protein